MTLRPIDYRKYPAFIFAELGTFLGPTLEGDIVRCLAGDICIKKIISVCEKDGKISSYITYKNGGFHSYDDEPIFENNSSKYWFKDNRSHRENDKPAQIISSNSQIIMFWCYKGFNYYHEQTINNRYFSSCINTSIKKSKYFLSAETKQILSKLIQEKEKTRNKRTKK
jgi:hypothetical protein